MYFFLSSEGSGESVHMRRLSRAFATLTHGIAKETEAQDKNRPLAPLDTSSLAFDEGICAYGICTIISCTGSYVQLDTAMIIENGFIY